MKKILGFLFPILIISFNFSCKKAKDKIDQLTEFDLNYSVDLSVPSASVSVNVPVDFTTPDIPTNSSSTFSSQKTISSKVTEIKLTKFDLVANAGSNFDYLKSISVYIQSAGQPEVQIATKANVPNGLSTINMDISDANIKEHIFGSSFKLRINITIDGAITSNQQMKINQTMHVKAVLVN